MMLIVIVNVVKAVNSSLFILIVLFWLLLLGNHSRGLAQQRTPLHDTSLVGSIVYRSVVKNMVSYITHNMLSDNYNLISNGEFSWRYFDEGSVVLDSGQTYRLKVELASLAFPDSNYILYAFHTNRLSYEKWDYSGGNVERLVVTRGGDVGSRFPVIMNQGLVAVSADEKSLIFVSGYMFLHDISAYFFAGGFTVEKIREYINIRYYNYSPADIVVSVDYDAAAIFYSKLTFKRYRVDWKHVDKYGYKESISAIDDE